MKISYKNRGKWNRKKKVYSKHWKQLASTLGLKEYKMFPNMKKLSQKLRKSEPYMINAEEGKYQWTPMII